MAPYSDVDLMLLRGERTVEELTPLVRRFTNAMFDAGFQLGHSLRNAAEAVQLARGDAVICSSLIDCRLIGGAQPLFEEFRDAFEQMVRKRSKAVCKAFYASRAAERQQYGESLYLLEPHVKRSRGGLRDIHLLRWIGFAEHGESDPDRLALMGAMSKFEHHRLQSAPVVSAEAAERNALSRRQRQGPARPGRAAARGRGAGLPRRRRACCRSSSSCATTSGTPTTSGRWCAAARRACTRRTAVSRVLDPVLGRTVEGDYRDRRAQHLAPRARGWPSCKAISKKCCGWSSCRFARTSRSTTPRPRRSCWRRPSSATR